MAAGNETVAIAVRHYSVPIGSYDWTDKSGIHDQLRRITVYANYEETVTEIRALRSCTAGASSVTPRTYKSTHGSSFHDDEVTMFFDYDWRRETHSCRRVSDAGFYTETETVQQCLSITERESTETT